jgi:hypothetical protein
MGLNIEKIADIRIQFLNSFSNPLEVEDVIFVVSGNCNHPIVKHGLVPYSNLQKLKDKYFARRQAVRLIENRSLTPALSRANEAFFFSYDLTYNVDYCYYFDFINESIQNYIYRKDGAIVFSSPYNVDFDERPYLYSELITNDIIQVEPKSQLWTNINGLYHITHKDNIVNIFDKGLLSHTMAHALEINKSDISNQSVQARRNHVHNKVPLYFNIKNPMTYTFSNKSNLVILKIEKKIMLLPGVIFSDGNAAANSSKYYTSLQDLNKLNWGCINGPFWNDYNDGKRIRCAEVLVPNKISTKHIQEIFVYDISTYNNLMKLLSNKNIPITIDKSYYF